MVRPAIAGLLLGTLVALSGAAEARRYASIIVDYDTGSVLHAESADRSVYPASLTKMMTLYMVFEALDSGKLKLDDSFTISRVAASRSPSRLGLDVGDQITVENAIFALITKSANDIATAIAEALGGTERKFGQMMTERAHRLGLTNTVFRNASGLWHSKQRTTARDMVRLVRALLRDFPHHYHYFGAEEFTYRGKTYENHNTLLTKYDGVDGVKTGYIRASGFNLAASVERGGHRLIGVVMGGKTPRRRDNLMASLFDRGFARLATTGGAIAELPSPPPPKPEEGSTETASLPPPKPSLPGWSIQIGAFERYAPAHLAVTRAARLVPALLRSRIAISRVEGDDGRVYRARLVGLTETKARASCDALKLREISCVVVPHTNGSPLTY